MKKIRETIFKNWVKLYKCSDCWEFLPKDRFNKNVRWLDFIHSKCKSCMNERIKKYRREHREEWNAYQREYWRKRAMVFDNPYLTFNEASNLVNPKDDIIVVQTVEEVKPVEVEQPEQQEVDNIILDFQWEYPEAYEEIMSDENLKRAFEERRDDETRAKELEKRQKEINKKKEEKEFEDMKNKFWRIAEEAFTDNWVLDEKKMEDLEYEMWNFSFKEDKEKFMKQMTKFSPVTFKLSRRSIADNIRWIRDWKIKTKDVNI